MTTSMAKIMKSKIGHLLGLLLVWSAFTSAIAGSSVRFRQISLEEGLSQSTVYCIYQDHLGFIWFGTYDGLNRYDGYDFKQFKVDPNDLNSISDNRILTIFEDTEHNLWVGTDGGGLNRFDRTTEQFVRYQKDKKVKGTLSHNRVRAVTQDAQGRIWVGTGGGGLNLMLEDGTFKIYRRGSSKEGSLSHNRVRVLLCDSKGRLWIGTGGGGLNLFQEETDNFKTYRANASDPHSISDNEINTIVEARDGSLWIGTYSGGLNRFDPETGKAIHYSHEPADFHALISNKVHALLEDDLGQIWVATDKGLDRFSEVSQTFVHYSHDMADPNTLSDSIIHSLYLDRSGVFWVGTRNGGINKFERGKQAFDLFQHEPGNPQSLADNRVNTMQQDLMGRLWIGTGGSGIDRFDPEAGSFRHYRRSVNDPNSLSDNRVLSMEIDKASHLWVGTRGGLNRTPLDGAGVFQRFLHDETKENSLANDVVWSLLVDHKGHLWVGTEGGLDRLEADGKTFTHFKHDPSRENSLPDNVIWSLFEDSHQGLWVGTENNGLALFNGDDSFRVYRHDPNRPDSLSNNTVLSIAEEGDQLWVGTWGGGLNALKGEDRFEHLSERDGLPNNVIYGILGDGRGNLWLSTNRGLSLYNPSTGAFRNYATNDGLQGMEFNPGSCFRGVKGEMFFGGGNGFNSFHPDNFRENTHKPEMLITAFRQHEEIVATNINTRSSYEMGYRENYLSFEFVAFDYHAPERNRYAYILEGLDDEWIRSEHREARYNNLEPGRYTFRVKGSNNDNVWNDDGVAISINIIPPFYRTTWFYLLCILATLALFFGAILFQRHLLKQEESKALVALELKGKTEELEEARRLQLSMLPKQLPELPHLSLAALMETATEVGGDYYDFHLCEKGILTAAVGDATGHGLRAGTLVTAFKGLFLSLVDECEPAAMLKRASQVLRQMGFRKMFMAMAVARFEGHKMTLAVAGMPPTYIYRAHANRVEPIVLKGMPLGGVAFPYQERTVEFDSGDVILFNSDGLEEMFNKENQMLGGQRVKEAFAKVAKEEPEFILESLLQLGMRWADGRPKADDITLVVVKVK